MITADGACYALQMNLTTIPILNDDGTVVVAEDGRNVTQPVLRFTARVRTAMLQGHDTPISGAKSSSRLPWWQTYPYTSPSDDEFCSEHVREPC